MQLRFRVKRAASGFVLLGLVIVACAAALNIHAPSAPVAQIIPRADTLFGDVRIDNYYWLKDKADPKVIGYIEAENGYTQTKTAGLKAFEDQLYDEMVGRLKETDTSAATKIDDYYYYTRTLKGLQYPIYCRKHGSLLDKEQVLLDLNAQAVGQKYINIGAYSVSPDHRYLAFAVDTSGSESYTVRVKDLQADVILPDLIRPAGPEVEWANDNNTFFYETLDETQRPYRLYRHGLGDRMAADELVYQEDDEAYYLSLEKTRSKQYLILDLESNTTNELWCLDANIPESKFQLVAARQHDVKYYIDHHADKFFIMTNEKARNFKIMETPVDSLARDNWHEYIAHDDSVKIQSIDAFRSNLVVYERSGGLQRIRIISLPGNEPHYIQFPDPAYSLWPGQNPVYDTRVLRFRYSSFVTPLSVFDYDMDSQVLQLIKQNEVKGYDKAAYVTDRIFVVAPDSIPVPIVLAYKKVLFRDNGSNPLLLEGYGAYGISSDADFSSTRLSLLDRGFVYAIAQVRGGDEMGRWWYDDGKLLNKRNTFTDFIACAEHLIEKKYTSRERLAITGGSAGGLLIGAVTTMRPELFRVVIANVPFVDILNTMLDPTIPLTVTEFEEWGNPHDSAYYFYMKSYSPYDNVQRKAYPTMLVTGGLNDPRVGYWEPTKWVARLRAMKTDNNVLLLKINMGEGHFGVSGRYAELKDVAFQYAFCLDALGIGR